MEKDKTHLEKCIENLEKRMNGLEHCVKQAIFWVTMLCVLSTFMLLVEFSHILFLRP